MAAPGKASPRLLREAGALLLAGAVCIALILLVGGLLDDPEYSGHAAFHLLVGATALVLGVGVSRLPPLSGRVRSLSRRVALTVLLFFGITQLMEAVGAFGWDGRKVTSPALTKVHDVAVAVSLQGVVLLAAPVAALMLVVAYAVGAFSPRVAEVLCVVIAGLFLAFVIVTRARII